MTEILSPPRDFAALKALIAERAAALPKRLTQIAAFALENPDEIAFGTVSSIAEQAEVQPSTLVRFSQALGYQGFSDMQEIFRSRLRDRILNYDERLQQLRQHAPDTSKPNVIFHGFCEASARSIAALQRKARPRRPRPRGGAAGRGRDHLPDRAPALLPDRLLHGLCAGQARCAGDPGRCGGRPRGGADHLRRPGGCGAGHFLHALRLGNRRAWRGRRRSRGCRSWPSPTARSRRWPSSPGCGSRSRRPISRASARWRPP